MTDEPMPASHIVTGSGNGTTGSGSGSSADAGVSVVSSGTINEATAVLAELSSRPKIAKSRSRTRMPESAQVVTSSPYKNALTAKASKRFHSGAHKTGSDTKTTPKPTDDTPSTKTKKRKCCIIRKRPLLTKEEKHPRRVKRSHTHPSVPGPNQLHDHVLLLSTMCANQCGLQVVCSCPYLHNFHINLA